MSSASSPAVLKGTLERKTKYTKKWTSRYCTFDSATRHLTYAESEQGTPKGTMIVSKVTRIGEIRENIAAGEITVLLFDGHLAGSNAGKGDAAGAAAALVEQWSFRVPTDLFETWYEAVRRSLATAGLMDPYNYGLPAIDPRQNLPFAKVPLEFLFKFSLLEKAIIYTFTQVRFAEFASASLHTINDGIAIVGDRTLYIFRRNADVVRCSPITNVKEIRHTKGNTVCVLVMTAPEADFIFECGSGLDEFKHALSVQYRALSQGKHLPSAPLEGGTKLEDIVAAGKFRMTADEGYKLQVASPTSKSRLKTALDQYEKQEGIKFDPQAHRARVKSKPQQAAVVGEATAAGTALPADSPLVRLLTHLQLTQYASMLLKQHVDLDVLQCMDVTDLDTFGVKILDHAKKILSAANDAALVAKMQQSGSAPEVTISVPVASTTPAATAPPSSAGNSTVTKPVIELSDDDDDLDAMIAASPRSKAAAPAIVLDDDDDDLDLLPVVSASPQKPPIILDDDDI